MPCSTLMHRKFITNEWHVRMGIIVAYRKRWQRFMKIANKLRISLMVHKIKLKGKEILYQ